jgi:SAM-dependent methyltransferase
MMERRMVEQLRRKKVDAAFYSIGGAPIAQAWKEWDDRYPPPWDTTPSLIGDYCKEERCVVDFGPGSGQPTLAAIRSFLDHIREIVLVNVSQAMLAIAQDYLHKNTQATITGIVADVQTICASVATPHSC